MYNPFQILTDEFQAEYRVNLSLVSPDGAIMLTLTNERGVAARRLISAAQRNDAVRLNRVIESIRLGIAIESGNKVGELLTSMTGGSVAPVRSGQVNAAQIARI
ncbi:DUF3509 domain-containing protein [Pseudomonas sp. BN414]|uniref:DUF3509 domain-containing protein n=1 Tax=Pseudomonas TaxID=286 RepID=UPI0015B9AFBE|nr:MULTISPECIES: DUF3509 domain-containing protein [Pseudomonas]MDH4569309.1 DUF3509 domain-containing protein [Pseudomonas sp. BN414]NWL78403.1 hypothetical protein [Pseudomonas taiwanensis]